MLVGAAVQIRRSGTFGFDSTLTSDYQMVAIPLAAFAVPQGSSIDQVRLEDFGGAIGFFVDDISFQAAATHSRRRRADAGPGRRALCAARPCGAACARRGGPAPAARLGAMGVIIDGGGSAITTGVKGDLYIPFAFTITGSTLIADVSGSVVLDLKLSASYATTPTVSIVASAPPTLSSALTAQDATLTGWTVSGAAGSRLRYSVTSASTITRLTHTLTVQAS